MRTGIASPILALSGERPDWEHRAGLAEVVTVAREADRLGYEFLTCPDHVAVPRGVERGEQFYDPLSTFSYLAALTERIRFLPFVLVLPFYHPLELAKRYGGLDHLSGGRLTLGVGVGNLREEFDVLDVPFDDRGARADDALRALRAAWGTRVVSYDGPFYAFDDLVVQPHAAQVRLPVWVGGHSARALRRAVTLGDGWAPAPVAFRGPDPQRLREMLATVDLPAGFDVLLGAAHPLDPVGDADRVRAVVAEAADAGATVLRLTVVHRSLEHYLEQLAAYAEIVGLASER
ncbi:LLM class F420-dependent oxidoreductase [Nocardioides sp. YIM 152315]|uniref:LLM class F420-dependent oxidoreductase n=1 Tax=Nocardioides sp. YIM 152315 TaxID=3031760 RepID=UPI0023DB3313|nr:LLM class F420-dependent oxidoreductase [Nocardioides sp. YIM 152315]MDF1604685.1 LLM class F420-dependent oxidoreductase [Nocardioides sp. YIM 152315]